MTRDPETRLVLACVSPAPRAGDIAELAAGPLDWGEAIAFARRERVTTLLRRGLRSAGVEPPPPEAAQTLKASMQRNVFWGMSLSVETARVATILRAGGVRALFHKGAPLSVLAYGDPGVRRSSDVDLLVAPGDVRRAHALLREGGYADVSDMDDHGKRFFEHTINQAPPVAREERYQVEVHARTHPSFASIHLDHPGMFDRAVPVSLGTGEPVEAPSPEDSFLIVATHALRSGWFKLEWATSLAWLAVRPGFDFALLERLAREAGVARMTAIGLLLARDVAGAPLPPAGDRVADADPAAAALSRELAAEPFWDMPNPLDAEGPDARMRSLHLRSRERARDRVRYVAISVFSPTTIEASSIRLPRALFWLYVPMRLARVGARAVAWALRRATLIS